MQTERLIFCCFQITVQWVPVMDANFDAPLNLWKLAYTESIFIAFLVIFAKKLYHRIKQHSLLSEKYYFMHITSPNATRFELTITEGFSNGWTKRLTLLTLFTASGAVHMRWAGPATWAGSARWGGFHPAFIWNFLSHCKKLVASL